MTAATLQPASSSQRGRLNARLADAGLSIPEAHALLDELVGEAQPDRLTAVQASQVLALLERGAHNGVGFDPEQVRRNALRVIERAKPEVQPFSAYVEDEPTGERPSYLSNSAMQTFARCQEKWRRRYIAREYEPPSPNMLAGGAFHHAEQVADVALMDEQRLATPDVVDLFVTEYDRKIDSEDEIRWGKEQPGELKDSATRAVGAYHDQRPEPKPIAVERKVSLSVGDVDFVAYLDLETVEGIVDRKLMGRAPTRGDLDRDPQATAYLAARKLEGNPAAHFQREAAVRTKTPKVSVEQTTRTDSELDFWAREVVATSEDIDDALRRGRFRYAPPGSWFCQSATCGHFWDCPGGGKK